MGAGALAASLAFPEVAAVAGASKLARLGSLALRGAKVGGTVGALDVARQGEISPESLSSAAKTAGSVAAMETGAPVALAGISKAWEVAKAPVKRAYAGLVEMATRGVSYNAVKRAIQTPGPAEVLAKEVKPALAKMRVGDDMARTKDAVQKTAVEAFDDTQKAIQELRDHAGNAIQAVDDRLAATGARVDLTPIIAKNRNAIADLQDPRIKALMGESPELKRISNLLDEVQKQPLSDIRTTLELRRLIDNTVTWSKMPLGPKVPDAVERILKGMRSDIQEQVFKQAEIRGVAGYKKAYAKFRDIADAWDTDLRKMYGTLDDTQIAQLNAFQKFQGAANKAGYTAELLANTARVLPKQAKSKVERLLNLSALDNIVNGLGAPSSHWVAATRNVIGKSTLPIIGAAKKFDDLVRNELVGAVARRAPTVAAAMPAANTEELRKRYSQEILK
jgi:hypothetical protein